MLEICPKNIDSQRFPQLFTKRPTQMRAKRESIHSIHLFHRAGYHIEGHVQRTRLKGRVSPLGIPRLAWSYPPPILARQLNIKQRAKGIILKVYTPFDPLLRERERERERWREQGREGERGRDILRYELCLHKCRIMLCVRHK